MEIYRKTWAEIRTDLLHHNIELIRNSFAKDTFFCPMVKANAYGHGDVKLGNLFQNWHLSHLGVCLIEEGLLMRQLGVSIPILVFRGFDQKGAWAMLQSQMIPVVSTWEQLDILLSLREKTTIHLKFDTGMNRLGFNIDEAERVLEKIKNQTHLKLQGVLTHLYNSEDGLEADGKTARQLHRFNEVAKVFENICDNFHALNSGGLISKMTLEKSGKKDGVMFDRHWGLRPGLSIYGYNPVEGANIDLKPAMTLKSHTSVVRSVKKGEGVSYGHAWRAERDSKVAVVPIGYADGWHRLLSNRAQVLWNGQRAHMVGNVCMDYLMVDVTDLPLEIENEVVFFGQSRTGATILANEVAKHAQTIPWEVLTSVGERVPRIYL